MARWDYGNVDSYMEKFKREQDDLRLETQALAAEQRHELACAKFYATPTPAQAMERSRLEAESASCATTNSKEH